MYDERRGQWPLRVQSKEADCDALAPSTLSRASAPALGGPAKSLGPGCQRHRAFPDATLRVPSPHPTSRPRRVRPGSAYRPRCLSAPRRPRPPSTPRAKPAPSQSPQIAMLAGGSSETMAAARLFSPRTRGRSALPGPFGPGRLHLAERPLCWRAWTVKAEHTPATAPARVKPTRSEFRLRPPRREKPPHLPAPRQTAPPPLASRTKSPSQVRPLVSGHAKQWRVTEGIVAPNAMVSDPRAARLSLLASGGWG